MKKKFLVAVSYLLILALGVMGTVAYFTDREAEVNVFTVGDVEIELNNSFDQGAELMPGKTIENKVSITNTGKNAAWVWFNLGVDAKVLKALKIDFADTNWGVANAEGAYLYPAVIPAGKTIRVLNSIKMLENVDATPDGDLYVVNAGQPEALNWNIKNNGYPTINLAAYAIQADNLKDADGDSDIDVYDAYKLYGEQWGANAADTGFAAGTEVADDAALKDALTSNSKAIVVELTEDVTYDVTAWQGNAMGGEATEEIVILGNGHTITFNHLNGDWNNIAFGDATLTIKDAKITNSGKNDGPWNRHDISFAGDVVLTNVVSDKALAFKAGATLTNVTINDANTSDTYAIWVQPNGQTVTLNGCTIDMLACTDGRGIKIDEQYIDDPAKVTLNVSNTVFKTEEKSAILVKSKAGAEINVNKVNISAVAADPVHVVWVDEASAAYADLVTVTGGKKIVEGTVKVVDAEDLTDVIPETPDANGVYEIKSDAVLVDTALFSDHTATESYTVNGNNAVIEGVVTSADAFTWEGGTIPAMSPIFSSADGEKVTVNDLTFTGTMSAVMLGNYVDSSSNWFKTELNNVKVVDAEVVSFSAGVSPAVCAYGTAVLNNCTITGTTLSELDTDPMWPVYDLVAVNYTDVTLNNTEVGSLMMWNQAKVTVAAGSEVDTITVLGNMNTTKYGLTVKAGATVGTIDLSAITDKARINITIEDGATVGGFVDNGVTYTTLAAWQAAQ